ncbi:MAG: alanine racemase [Oscillospiraceae bacterium]|nr:alanine racemase [Oscillospiraceae bacterium]
MVINLDAIEHNVKNIKNKIGSHTKLLSVIKADAYGCGAVEIARAVGESCDFFGVATIEEALEIKRAGIDTPVLVLGRTDPYYFDLAVEHDIRTSIFRKEDAAALSQAAQRAGKMTDFHFALDTGMSRIGFQVSEADADICKEICEMPMLRAEGIYSHFATADEEDLTKAAAQREAFIRFCAMLESRGVSVPMKHLNNSAAIMNFSEHFDMVRAGIILYGMYPSPEVDQSLLDIQPALSWISSVSHLKKLEKGREISYGGTYVTDSERMIATVPVGYADGYPRCLSNIGEVLICGKRAPIVGRVCMDQFMIDVTDIPGVAVGSKVTLVGFDGEEHLSMEEVADKAHSFNYELSCRLARRVPRIYTRGGKEVKEVSYI